MLAKRKKRKSGDDEIPVSSFSDIAFLLIIFFILTTTLQSPTAFLADIPAGEKGQAEEGKKPTVAINNADIRFNDAPVTIAELRRELLDMEFDKLEPEERIVLLESTGNVRYQDYFEVMSVISGASGLVAIIREGE